MENHPAILCIAGPTASGKTDAAIAVARRIGGEVICCDAFSVYRGMEILTAAPEAPADVPHQLVGILDPAERYDAARFAADCERLVPEIRARGIQPVVAGGTALYLRGWLKGFGAPVARDPALRDELRTLADAEGVEAVHALLRAEDPARAAELHPNDLRRVVRAIEITRITGKPASSQREQWSGPDKVNATVVYLVREAGDLEDRIRRRTAAMFAAGVVDEVDALRERTLSPEAAKVLGYAELCAFLDGDMRLDEVRERIVVRTRQFARKQMTFFRSFDGAIALPVTADETPESIADRVLG